MEAESMELSFARLASSLEKTGTFEKRKADTLERPEYVVRKPEFNRQDIQEAREKIAAAQGQLITMARAKEIEQSARIEGDREAAQQRIDQIKEGYSMVNVARELSSYVSAIWSLLPGSRANVAARIWEAQELIYESALEPNKLERAVAILSQLEARNN